MAKELSGGGFLQIGCILKTVLISFVITAVLLFIAAVVVTYVSVSEAVIGGIVSAITALCILWCGMRASGRIGRNGLLSGAVSGLIYVVVLFLAGSIIFGTLSFQMATALSMLVGIGCGAIGGIIGVNRKRKRR